MVDKELIISSLKKTLTDVRFNHTLAVVSVAEKLAVREGLSCEKAIIAGLLHDYAKGLEKEKLVEFACKSAWKIDETELAIPGILHAPAGAYLAHSVFGVEDKEVLEAIRFHTIGDPEMGRLAWIIFIADFIEPNREFPGLNEIRAKVGQGLISEVMISICDHSIKYNIDQGRMIHPNTLLLRNSLLGGYS